MGTADGRASSKAATRQRLLDATIQVLAEDGEAALTTTKVTTLAGIAQPTFYVHFDNIADLLHGVVHERLADWTTATRQARRRSRTTPDRERFRETFRVPMHAALEAPELFRLMMRHRFDDHSPIGAWSTQTFEAMRKDLVSDLVAGGFSSKAAKDRRQVGMIADGVIALTTEMIVGHLDGRFPDVEETIDVLVAFSKGYLTLQPRPAPAGR